ncbi:MAG: hypothetical protein IPI49_31050 [Myxococcales bacterium]|nr:hypothetical protein [Myxococcales bacterium]
MLSVRSSWILLVALTATLGASSACGGGGDEPEPEPPPPPVAAPETQITAQPSPLTASDRAELSFSSPTPRDGKEITFECAADGGSSFTACTSPVTRTGLTSGAYSLRVRARWQGGEADATPAEAAWTVDRTPPDTTITAGPQGDVAPVATTFTFSSGEPGATFECRLAPAAYAACTSPYALTVALADATFSVRAVDAVGNADDSPATRAFRGIRPQTVIDSQPAAVTRDETAQLTFSSPTAPIGAAIVFECAADGSTTYAACTSPVTRAGLTSGSYSLRVRARWQGSEADDSPAEASWTVDRIAPDTTITAGPSGDTPAVASMFSFSAETGATFECSADGGAFAACLSPFPVMVSAGDHTFAVRGTDAVGNQDASPATRSYRGIAAETSLDSAPPALTASTSATLTFSSPTPRLGGVIVFECAADGGATYAACTSPVTRTGLTSGSYSLRVRARWQGGEVDATPAEATWTVDLTAPDTSITGGPSGDTGLGASTFTFTSEPDATFECRVDAAAFAPCTSPHPVTVTLGDHTFSVRASDALGNQDASPATRSYRGINTRAAPETQIDSAPPAQTSSSSATRPRGRWTSPRRTPPSPAAPAATPALAPARSPSPASPTPPSSAGSTRPPSRPVPRRTR